MKYKSIIGAALLGALSFTATGCVDEFAKENTNPSAITKADVRYLFTQVLASFEPSGYTQWFYNNVTYTMPWAQSVLADETGNLPNMNLMGAYSDGLSYMLDIKLYTEEIKYVLSQMEEVDQMRYQSIEAMCKPLLVYMGLFSTDMYGSIPYTEAARGLHEGILTPKYERQEDLFKIWDEELKSAAALLNSHPNGQVALGKQDFIYQGDLEKWAKFANSLRLKLAVRLLHKDKDKAIQIAREVMESPIMEGLSDDFFYCKGAQEYHWGDNVFDGQGNGIGSEQLVNLLVKNKDPRVRFIFQKNDFNSEVVQAFFDADANRKPSDAEINVPEYILNNVDYTTDDNGKKTFKGWKGLGEPWVRYYGAPTSTEARNDASLNEKYFDASKFRLPTSGGSKQYVPLARINREMLQGGMDYTYPCGPNVGTPVIDNQDNAWTGLHFSTAEVYLYLAEIGLIAPELGIDVEKYYKDAIELSIREYNELALRNKVPYYTTAYDKEDALIALQEEEVAATQEVEDYQLTGSTKEKLEKVYIQEYIHFMLQPQEQFVQVRRSGVPMRNSSILPWKDFSNTAGDPNYYIPRRWNVGTPLESDLMYDIKVSAFKEQGFTTGTTSPKILHDERVWYDQGAPDFGEGPNF